MCVPAPGTFNPPGEHVPCHGAKFSMCTSSSAVSLHPPTPPRSLQENAEIIHLLTSSSGTKLIELYEIIHKYMLN